MASLDDVALRLDDGELLIAPGGIEPREDLMHPSLPVDGGRLCAGLGIDRDVPAGYLGGGFDTDEVPLWVELVYGHEVVTAARDLLAARRAGSRGPASDPAAPIAVPPPAVTVATTWFSRPSPTARCLHRMAEGLWMRRYWPSPVGSPIARPDRDLLAVELASLSLRAEAPECFGPGGLTGVLLDGHAAAVPELARRVLEGRADETSQRRLRVILRDVLAWLCEGQDLEAVEPDADRERGDADELLELYSLRDDLAHSVPARGWEQVLEEIGRADVALAAGATAEDEAPGPPAGVGAGASRDSVDWEVNAPGLLDTDTGAVVWSADDGELRVTAPLAPSAGRALPHAYARVYFEGEDLPVLVDLHPDASGRLLMAHETLERSGRVECVDVVSVPRPMPALRGPERAAMVRDQEAATEWARRRTEDVYDFLEETFPYEGRGLPDDPVPEGLADGEPWVGQLVGPSGGLSL
ncbi:hypothetical protein [Actinomyces sp. oral taxon 414]|uniref:hypothetical protein n=1 Tax=Actinomyces sp. oral taxon 414 TaxID=712122 RepID=UPI000AEA2A04|nr:hypothetical protein [Actinomyces sp. oral taxon 414]